MTVVDLISLVIEGDVTTNQFSLGTELPSLTQLQNNKWKFGIISVGKSGFLKYLRRDKVY